MDQFSLSDTYLLRGATIGDVETVRAISDIKEFGDGEAILASGDRGQDLMIVIEGRAQVQGPNGEAIEDVRLGSVVGEISFLDGKNRTASVVAQGKARALLIPAEDLRRIMRERPSLELVVLRNAALALCSRLREANAQVESLTNARS